LGDAVALPFRIGNATVEDVPSTFSQFYTNLAGWLGVSTEPLTGIRTIPIPHARISDATWVYKQLQTQAHTFPSSLKLLILDVATEDRSDMPHYNVFIGLSAAFSDIFELCADVRIVMLISRPIADGDVVKGILDRLVEGGRVSLIFDSGAVLGRLPPESHLAEATYRTAIENAKTNPIDILKSKLVRRIGHYQIDKRELCLRYYYDGTGSEYQIDDLFVSIFDKLTGPAPDLLISHSRNEAWLDTAVASLALKRNIAWLKWSDSEPRVTIFKNPLLVVPMVDSGRTLAGILKEVSSPNGAKPRVLSVLSTGGDRPEHGTTYISSDGVSAEVRYLLRVPQIHYSQKDCPLCSAGIPRRTPSTVDYGVFSSDEFWHMVFEAGIKLEDDVPVSRREPLGYVPDFPVVVLKNGPLIASRIATIIDTEFQAVPPNIVIICPAYEKGSEALSDCLKRLVGYDVVRVERPILDVFLNTPLQSSTVDSALSLVPPSQASALERLRALQEHSRTTALGAESRVVLLDEFSATGSTRRALMRLAEYYEFRVLGFFSLAVFHELEPDNLRTVALYDLDYEIAGGTEPGLTPS
jgi:hypothetical protein